MPSNEKNCLVYVVLGMHRSGTSALSGAINFLGINFGQSLIPASSDNKAGFWEQADIVQLNDWVLQLFDSSWDSVDPLPENWENSKKVSVVAGAIKETLKSEFGNAGTWGIKDPRISILLPLWHRIFHELGYKPFFVIVIRNPREVAKSLETRNGFQLSKSYLLWLKYMLEIEKNTRGEDRVFISYDYLLKDPQLVLNNIELASSQSWPIANREALIKACNYFDTSLRHHYEYADPKDADPYFGADINRDIAKIYNKLAQVDKNTDDNLSAFIDQVYRKFFAYIESNGDQYQQSQHVKQIKEQADFIGNYLRSLNKEVFIVVPVRSDLDHFLECVNIYQDKARDAGSELIIVLNMLPGSKIEDPKIKIKEGCKVRIISNYPSFDINELNQPDIRKLYIILYGFNVSYLARIANRNIFDSVSGESFVISV